jgi:hypothetical protein
MGELDMKLKKGGELWYFSHDRDAEDGGGWRNVTKNAFQHLFDECDLEDGVTLRDIFLLARENMWILEPVIGNWIKEIVAEGLDNPSKTVFEYDPYQCEYLELYWHLRQSTHDYSGSIEKTFSGTHFPDFGGTGYEIKETFKEENSGFEYLAGTRISMAIDFSPTPGLIDLPVKLNRDCRIYDEDYTKPVETRYNKEEGGYPTIYKADGMQFTLGHILQGIFWELSFCGGPEDRDAKAKELKDTIARIDRGEEELIEIDNVEDFFKNKLKKES